MDYKGKNVLVMGLGASGKSAAKLLRELEANVYVYDDYILSEEFVNSDVTENLDLCVISPGVPSSHRLVRKCIDRGIKIISELQLGVSLMQCDIIAITGTNGKTTTTMMTAHILRSAGVNAIELGNIGVPVCDYAMKLKPSDVAVIEVSSFQLEFTDYFKPNIAAIINIAPDHLDRHKDYEDYIGCKFKLFSKLDDKCRAVINYDCNMLRELSLAVNCPVTYFSSKYKVKGCYIEDNNIYCNGFICSLDDLALSEPHNVENALCALAITAPAGISKESARDALMTFKSADYRMSDRGIKDGKRYINDSKGTNIHSTLAACRAVDGETALIIGGSDKGENYTELFTSLPFNIKYVYATGENAELFYNAAIYAGYTSIVICKDLVECIEYAKTQSVVNILFSPASASFDRYTSYAERGKHFDSII